MKKIRFHITPTKVDDFLADDLISDADDWREKAERLQARRWRKLRDLGAD